MNNESILNSIKKNLGINPEEHFFDSDIVMHINSTFSVMNQMGVGPVFSIKDETSVWTDYISDMSYYEMIKTYVFLKVRMIFDPPQNSSHANSINELIKEYEWRMSVINSFSNGGDIS